MAIQRSQVITLSGMGVQSPGGDPRPPQRRKDTKHLRMPGMFGGKRVRFQTNQSHPWPIYRAPVSTLGTGKMATVTNYPARIIPLGEYDNSRPE